MSVEDNTSIESKAPEPTNGPSKVNGSTVAIIILSILLVGVAGYAIYATVARNTASNTCPETNCASEQLISLNDDGDEDDDDTEDEQPETELAPAPDLDPTKKTYKAIENNISLVPKSGWYIREPKNIIITYAEYNSEYGCWYISGMTKRENITSTPLFAQKINAGLVSVSIISRETAVSRYNAEPYYAKEGITLDEYLNNWYSKLDEDYFVDVQTAQAARSNNEAELEWERESLNALKDYYKNPKNYVKLQ